MVNYVFVTGGVVSGLGKGITAASLGRLLKARGYQVTMQKFHDIFVKAIAQKQKNDEDVFICEFNDVKKIIPLHEIYYFDIRNRVVTVHYGQSEFSFYSKLDIIEETLANKHFVRIHRSFIVNLCYIDHIVSKSVFLINKEELPIGATYQKSLKEQFSNYLLEIA